MTEVRARGAKLEVRTVSLTKALLKQVRIFQSVPPEPFVKGDDLNKDPAINLALAVGWFRGVVLGYEYEDCVLFARDGDLYIWRVSHMRSKALFKGLKQLYI